MAISDPYEIEAPEKDLKKEGIALDSMVDKITSAHESSIPTGEIKTSKALDFKEFLNSLKGLSQADESLKACLAFMRDAISQEGNPRLKEFWEVKNHAISFFKDKLHAGARTLLWQEYRDLSNEAKQVKDILDSNAAFAIEQISLALRVIDEELTQIESGKLSFDFNLETPCTYIENRLDRYKSSQNALYYYNTFALRVNSLRKELIKTEMRVRHKNSLFKNLSSLGDRIFPKRKEFITAVSSIFVEDVTAFIDESFDGNNLKAPFYVLREEIKGIQAFARKLTLDTKAFSDTRKQLSHCWDRVREVERERKKTRILKKETYQQNLDEILNKFKGIQGAYGKGEINTDSALEQLDAILRDRDTELGRDERNVLKKEHADVSKVMRQKRTEERDEHLKQKQQKKKDEEQLYLEQKDKLLTHLSDDNLAVENNEDVLNEVKVGIKSLALQGVQKRELNQLIRNLKDLINEKKEQKIIENVQDVQGLSELKTILTRKEIRRREIKSQLESYRKEAGNSGMDFTQAMTYQELVSSEKSKLEIIDQSIKGLKVKINQLKTTSGT